MQPYQARVIQEKEELTIKLNALEAFFNTSIFDDLPRPERSRLLRQAGIMQQYIAVLGERIAAFSDKVA